MSASVVRATDLDPCQGANDGTRMPRTAATMLHVTLPAGDVRHVEPCVLGTTGIAAMRETVLPKLVRGSIVLPARPRYRLSGSINAPGGRLFELRVRHGAGFLVARIGIGWRDHGASLVWAACGRRHMAEPRRPWVVDVLDAAGVAMLNDYETSRLGYWVPVLAAELAWAATPSDAFLSARVLRVDDDHPWEVRETREIGPPTRDLRESDVAGELLLHPPRRRAFTFIAPVRAAVVKRATATPPTASVPRAANRADARRAAARLRSAVTKVMAQSARSENRLGKTTTEHVASRHRLAMSTSKHHANKGEPERFPREGETAREKHRDGRGDEDPQVHLHARGKRLTGRTLNRVGPVGRTAQAIRLPPRRRT